MPDNQYRAANRERLILYDRQYRETHKEQIKARRNPKPEVRDAYTERHRERLRQVERERRRLGLKPSSPKRDPYKEKACRALREAVRYRKIEKPAVCSRCGKPGIIHGHHEDYSKPLEVIWLCSICHGIEHRRKARALAGAPRASEPAFPDWICNNCGQRIAGGLGKPTICPNCGWNNWRQDETPPAAPRASGSEGET